MFIEDEKILTPQDWVFPIPIAYGPGRIWEVGDYCTKYGISNPLIVTDKGSKNLSFIDILKKALKKKNVSFGFYSGIAPNPNDKDLKMGCDQFSKDKHDGIIAIGGGSALDGGKAIGLTVNSGKDLWRFDYEKNPPKIDNNSVFPKLITIPTTAGTGAETESTAMVTHSKKLIKFCVWHPMYKPCQTILDPMVTLDLPFNLTAWTGLDALTHAIEAYLVPDFNPIYDAMALESLHLIWKYLPRACDNLNDLNARSGMLIGSCMAGVSFLKGLGLVHAISHMIGAEFNTHHGLTNAIILPTVLDFNLVNMGEKTNRITKSLGLKEDTQHHLISCIKQLLTQLEIPESLSEIGVPDSCAKRIAKKAMFDTATSTNPVKVSVTDIEKLINASIIS